MNLGVRCMVNLLMALALGIVLFVTPKLSAQDHVVRSADLHREILKAQQSRQANLAKVEKFFSSQPAKKALSTVKIDSEKVQEAVPYLNDEELTRLALRTDKIQNDFAAGALNNQEITYIIIALATAVLILIIVAAR